MTTKTATKLSSTPMPIYNTLPIENIEIDYLESLISERMNLLDFIDQKIQIQTNVNQDYTSLTIKQKINSLKSISWESEEGIRNDNISFFLIGMAFCKNEATRLWLSNLEAKLYIKKLEESKIPKDLVFESMNIPLIELTNVNPELIDKIQFKKQQKDRTSSDKIYRIPFEYVFNLIPTMNYFIHKGFVYLHDADRMSIIETVFKENTLRKYTNLSKSIDNILEDKRIHSLLKNLEATREMNKLLDNKNKKELKSLCSLNDIEDHAEQHFPLCMQVLHRYLSKESHLKHNGRLQYGLFLKGIGLSFDESLAFWKKKFSAKTTLDKFEKEYAYNIRHNYGLEGKRANYPPWSCSKIQSLQPPNSTEMHGCPYKIFSEDKLRGLLYDMKLKEIDVLKILDKKKTHEYSICCIRQYEAKFPELTFEKVGIHPNYYYESATKNLKSQNQVNKASNNKPKAKIQYEDFDVPEDLMNN